MSDLVNFLNLFAPPAGIAQLRQQQELQRKRESQLATAQSLKDLVVGSPPQDPGGLFVDNPMAGGRPLGGFAGVEGAIPEGPQRDFISMLLQSGDPQTAQQGTALIQDVLTQQATQRQAQGKEDIAAKARIALSDSRQKAIARLQAAVQQETGSPLSPGLQFQADIFGGGGPSSQEAFKGINQRLDPFSLSQGQKRFSGLGLPIVQVKKETNNLTPLQKNVAATGVKVGTPEFHQRMQQALLGGTDKVIEKEKRVAVRKFGQVQQSIDNYSALLSKTGAEIIPGESKAKIETAYFDLLLELKELYNLGVLNGPDLMIMQRVITDPTSVKAQALEITGGKSAFVGQLDILREKLSAARDLTGFFDGPSKSNQTELDRLRKKHGL